jgi:hypothetical protein
MCGENDCGRFAFRQNLINGLNSGQARNIHHLGAAGENSPEEDHGSQRVLMKNGNSRTWTNAELLQTRCHLPALQVQGAKADVLAGKNESGFLREPLGRSGK